MHGGLKIGDERVPGRNMLSRWRNMSRDDKEIYLVVAFAYIWLIVFAPYTWFSTVPYRLDAIDKVLWAVTFLLVTDLVYCWHEYGLILDLRRDFNFYASMTIISLIGLFFFMLIFFW